MCVFSSSFYFILFIYLFIYFLLCTEVTYFELFYWRASVASETLTGLTQLKIGDMSLFIYMCVDVRMSFCTLTLAYFCVRSVFDPVPNFTKQNPPV